MKEKAWREKKEETGRGRASCYRHNVAAELLEEAFSIVLKTE